MPISFTRWHVPKWTPPANLAFLGLIAIAGAFAWTLIGCLIAVISGSLPVFWKEWLLMQGFFAVAAAIYLGLVSLSPALAELLGQASDSKKIDLWLQKTPVIRFRRTVIGFVTIAGTATTTSLGFSVSSPTRYFMWATCLGVCVMAGLITWHAIEVLFAATQLDTLKIKFFVYSPGETRSLKKLAVYFVTFSVAVTIGYIFAFAGTMSPLWQGNPTWVNAVRAFWPIIYVPLCLLITTYPHLAIHRLIRQEKDRLIMCYQEQINLLIADGKPPSQADIERVNALADLIRKIEDSPSFALNFPIALSAIFTYIVNIGSLFIPKEAIAQIVRSKLLHL